MGDRGSDFRQREREGKGGEWKGRGEWKRALGIGEHLEGNGKQVDHLLDDILFNHCRSFTCNELDGHLMDLLS